MEERAGALRRRTSTATAWRLVGLMHLAETQEQAYRGRRARHRRSGSTTSSTPPPSPRWPSGEGTNVKEFIDFMNESGLGTIGTPDDAVRADRAACGSSPTAASAPTCSWPTTGPTPAAKWRSYELFARHVVPRFQGQSRSTARRQGPRPRRPAGAGREQPGGRGDGDGQVPGRAGGEGLGRLTSALEPLPATFDETRKGLWALACYVISPERKARTGRIGLRPTGDGFGTPPFEDGSRVVVHGDRLPATPAGLCPSRPSAMRRRSSVSC